MSKIQITNIIQLDTNEVLDHEVIKEVVKD